MKKTNSIDSYQEEIDRLEKLVKELKFENFQLRNSISKNKPESLTMLVTERDLREMELISKEIFEFKNILN